MGIITRETIDKIFDAAQIEEVVGEFVNLKKSGSNFKGLSPFTQEKTPSFYVSPAKQIFKDFSSGKGGNVVSFLMEVEHFTYPEALKYLAKKYNIQVEEEDVTPEQEQQASERESIYLISEFAKSTFEDQLWKTDEGKSIGLSYFKERGFSEDTIRDFGLGYSLRQKDAFSNLAITKGYSGEFLEKSGIGIKNERGWYDRFWGRVMFPIYSISGRVLGFGGRVLDSQSKTAKYLNSPESVVYHKSKVLYGLFQSKQTIVKDDLCYLVEGYTDVISMHQAGIKNVVASSGTALTKEQISLIQRFTKNVTILYDGDAAGIKASFRGIDMFLESGMNVRVVLFPDGEDPDSFAKSRSSDELQEFLKESQKDFMAFKTDLLIEEAKGDPIKRASMIREIVASIALIPDPISRDVYIQECSRRMDMDEKVLFAELQQFRNKIEQSNSKKSSQQRSAPNESMNVVRPPQETIEEATKDSLHYEQEKAIIWLLLTYGEKLDFFYSNTEKEREEDEEMTLGEFVLYDLIDDNLTFVNPVFQAIFNQYATALEKEEVLLPTHHFTRSEDIEIARVASDLLTEPYQISDWSKVDIIVLDRETRIVQYAKDALYRFKELKLEQQIKKDLTLLENPEITPEERMKILDGIQKKTQVRVKLNKLLNRSV